MGEFAILQRGNKKKFQQSSKTIDSLVLRKVFHEKQKMLKALKEKIKNCFTFCRRFW